MRYDVFLSFQGEEIRKTFLSHLLHSLDRKGIRSVTSAPSSPSVNQAIRQSLVAISVISKNYTSLDLWVEELGEIIGCPTKAVPVFLRVDPPDVLRVLSLAEDSLGISALRRYTLKTVKNWLDGHLTRRSGFNSSDWEDDSQLVDQITCFVSDTVKQNSISNRWCPRLDWLTSPWAKSRTVSSKLHLKAFNSPLMSSSSTQVPKSPILHRSKPSQVPKSPILHRSKPSHENVIKPSPDESPTRPVLCRSNSSETIMEPPWYDPFTEMNPFADHITIEEASCCDIRDMKHRVQEVLSMLRPEDSTNKVRTIGIYGMEGVGKTTLAKYVYEEISSQFQHHFFITDFSKKGSSLLEILASEILNTTTNFNGSSDVIREMVGRKVLLLVDSADDIKQLKGFTKEVRLFGPGSRFIVITQDRSLLFQCGVKHIYQVGCPGYDEAIQLFSQFAFMQTNPVSGFERFSGRAVEVAGRIPLALKLLGSYLYGRDEDDWESTLCRLEESHNNYTTEEILKYIGADDSTPTTPSILELGENEENRFPLYSFTLQ